MHTCTLQIFSFHSLFYVTVSLIFSVTLPRNLPTPTNIVFLFSDRLFLRHLQYFLTWIFPYKNKRSNKVKVILNKFKARSWVLTISDDSGTGVLGKSHVQFWERFGGKVVGGLQSLWRIRRTAQTLLLTNLAGIPPPTVFCLQNTCFFGKNYSTYWCSIPKLE